MGLPCTAPTYLWVVTAGKRGQIQLNALGDFAPLWQHPYSIGLTAPYTGIRNRSAPIFSSEARRGDAYRRRRTSCHVASRRGPGSLVGVTPRQIQVEAEARSWLLVEYSSGTRSRHEALCRTGDVVLRRHRAFSRCRPMEDYPPISSSSSLTSNASL